MMSSLKQFLSPKDALSEVLALDAAVAAASSLTDAEETLTVVTADHGHVFNYAGYQSRLNPIFGLADLERDEDGMPYTTLLYATGPGHRRRNLTMAETDAETSEPDYRQMAGVPMESETHGATDVAVYARGPFAHLFRGVVEQNVIPHFIAYAACIRGFGGLDGVDELAHCR